MSADTPRVGIRTARLTDERLRYVRQLGVEDVFVDPVTRAAVTDPHLGGDEPEGLLFRQDRPPTAGELRDVRDRIGAAGLRFAGIQTVPGPFYERIALGPGDATEGIEWYEGLVRSAGAAGVPVVGYQWCPGGVYRTDEARQIRGGATATAYDHDEFEDRAVADAPDEATMWDRYEAFLEAI
ncbi:MAG: mannonate dehydratase, partial [Halobacteriales archaeon]